MLRAFFLRLEAKTFVSTGAIATMIAFKVTDMIRNAARSRATRAVVCGRNQLTPAAHPRSYPRARSTALSLSGCAALSTMISTSSPGCLLPNASIRSSRV
jgi:hypothetical protein